MPHSVRLSSEADTQVRESQAWIAREKSVAVARRYIAALPEQCASLEVLPHRGTRRDDLLKGVRTMGFKRRVTIVFDVGESEVVIVAVLYGGRSLAKHFSAFKKPT